MADEFAGDGQAGLDAEREKEAIAAFETPLDLQTESDLYKILGVRKGADADEIKKAYRKRSLKYHPDKNPDDPDAKLKFQKIAEAFSILSDRQKRLKYDKSGDMDLENFDMDQFMNMWVGEMMEEGGMVEDMMKDVLPWTDDDDKMRQFMEANITKKGKNWVCNLDGKSFSNKRLMQAHFEKNYKYECEDWGKEQLNTMKASFESFMKQLTGIGDSSGEFLMPDGTKASMSQVKGVPDIRSHFQTKIDKGLKHEKVLELYRKLADENSAYNPDTKELMELLNLEEGVAEDLKKDHKRLLRRVKRKIDELNEEEDEEGEFGDVSEFAGLMGGDFGGDFDGLNGLGSLESMLGGMDLNDEEAMMKLLGGAGGPGAMFGMLGGTGGGFGGLGGFEPPGRMAGVGRTAAKSNLDDPSTSELESVRPGDHILVVLGRSSVGGGMSATVHENDQGRKSMLVQLDGEPEPHRFPYRNLVPVESTFPSKPSCGVASTASAAPPVAATGLAAIPNGAKVRVVDGRNFEKFRGGMVGSVVKNNVDCRNMLVRFEDTSTSGPDPLTVGYRHLEPA